MLLTRIRPLRIRSGVISIPPANMIKGLMFALAADSEASGIRMIEAMPFKDGAIKSYYIPYLYNDKKARLVAPHKYRPKENSIPEGYKYYRALPQYQGRNLYTNYGLYVELIRSRVKSFNKEVLYRLTDVLRKHIYSLPREKYTDINLVVPVYRIPKALRTIRTPSDYTLYKILFALSFIDIEYITEFLASFDRVIFVSPDGRHSVLPRDFVLSKHFRVQKLREILIKLSNTSETGEEYEYDVDPETDEDSKPETAEISEVDTPTTDTTPSVEVPQAVQKVITLQNKITTLPEKDKDKYEAQIASVKAKYGDTSKEVEIFADMLLHNIDTKQLEKVPKVKGISTKPVVNNGKFSRPIPPNIPATYSEKAVPTLNPEMRKCTLKGFNENYTETILEKDISNVMETLTNKAELPLKVVNIEVDNTSDDLNRKDTWTLELVDPKGGKHKVVLDVPRVYDGNRIRIGGGVKAITKQLVRLPVVKIKPNKVEISTNANKLTLEVPHTDLVTLETKALHKAITTDQIPSKYYVRGNRVTDNKSALIPIDYYEMSKYLERVTIEEFTYVMSQKLLEVELSEHFDISSISEYLQTNMEKIQASIVGYTETQLICCDVQNTTMFLHDVEAKTNTPIGTDIYTVSEDIFNKLSQVPKLAGKLKVSSGKKLSHTRVTVAKKSLTLASILCIKIGLTKMLEKLGLYYKFIATEGSAEDIEYPNMQKIVLQNGVIYYRDLNYQTQLITNGLFDIDFSDMTYEMVDDPSSYVEYFIGRFGSPIALRSSLNIITALIDPITYEVLVDLSLPTEIEDLMIYASNLMNNGYHLDINDARNYRVRGTEIIPATLARVMSRAYEQVLLNTRHGKVAKLSIKQDALVNMLLQERIVEEVSVLNPVLEFENHTGKITFKGIGGINMERAFDSDRGTPRRFHGTMLGIMGLSTPDSGSVGIVKHLPANAAINNLRGYLQPVTDVDGLNATNILSVSELLSPMTNRKSDPPRASIENLVSSLTARS
jgi:hypothetical protein